MYYMATQPAKSFGGLFEPGEDATNIFMSKTSKTSGNALPEVFNFWQAGSVAVPGAQTGASSGEAEWFAGRQAFDDRQQVG